MQIGWPIQTVRKDKQPERLIITDSFYSIGSRFFALPSRAKNSRFRSTASRFLLCSVRASLFCRARPENLCFAKQRLRVLGLYRALLCKGRPAPTVSESVYLREGPGRPRDSRFRLSLMLSTGDYVSANGELDSLL